MRPPSTTTAGTRWARTSGAVPGAALRLEDLERLSLDELLALYRAARTPRIEDLDGALRGHALAVPGASRVPLFQRVFRAYVSSPLFAWCGKTFSSRGLGLGEGRNRLLFDRVSLFPFRTFVGRSRAGDFDAVQLDYDDPGNPPLVRSIRDEVREVAPDLWLGLAYLRLLGRDVHWLVFALARE